MFVSDNGKGGGGMAIDKPQKLCWEGPYPEGIIENSQGVEVRRVPRAAPKTPGKVGLFIPTPEVVADT